MSHALIVLAPGFEELEAVTVIDLLRRAQIKVTVAGLSDGPITGSRQTVILPDQPLSQIDQAAIFDLIVLPGGLPGADHLRDDEGLIRRLQAQVEAGRRVAAICAAPKVLARAGLITGKRITHYPGALSAQETAGATVTTNAVEVDGLITTSRGPGTAMDFALSLIEQLEGTARRNEVEQGLVR